MSQHQQKNSSQSTENQNNRMSGDPRDGSRTAAERPTEEQAQDQATIEAYGRAGAKPESEE